MIERRPITDRAEWLEWRKADVTASNVGALFGVHPYVTALRLYAEKRGTEFEPLDEQSKILRRGRWLEPAVANAVAELRPDWRFSRATDYLRNPELRLGATPDFYIASDKGSRGVLQIKTVAPSVWDRDWQKGAEPPLWVLLQAATEMMLDDAAFAAVGVMLVDPHNMEVAICEFERNFVVEAKIILAVGEFWKRVEVGAEPEPDYGRDRDVLKALRDLKPEPGEVVDPNLNHLPQLLADRATMLAEIKAQKELIEKIETELIHRIGDSETALVEGFRITYKTVDVKGYTVQPRSSRQLRILDRRS
jgi:predicted phage-related endonuclease